MITESKLKTGVLKFGGTGAANATGGESFAAQASNVRLTPNTSTEGDPLETLSGDTISADSKTDWTLNITAVQDFDDPDGFLTYCFDNDGDDVTYHWKPSADSPSFHGTVSIRAIEIGGDVNKRLTSAAAFPCTAKPTLTADT